MDIVPTWMKCFVAGYFILTIAYIIDIVYRNISNNHEYLSVESMSANRLEKIIDTSKNARYLEIMSIEGIQTDRGESD